MAIELYWDNDAQTTLLLEFNGRWTWEELHRTLAAIKKITDAVDYEIAALVDVSRGLHILPGDLFSAEGLHNARLLMTLGHDGTGPLVIVGANPLIKTVYDVLHKLDPSALGNVRFAKTLEEARLLLKNSSAKDAG
ncbi:MAG: hypothetical protein JNJ61_12750 [Anaerolineae bacterium]|nr:hypothetical protein [Anaerolineae bacterium]